MNTPILDRVNEVALQEQAKLPFVDDFKPVVLLSVSDSIAALERLESRVTPDS